MKIKLRDVPKLSQLEELELENFLDSLEEERTKLEMRDAKRTSQSHMSVLARELLWGRRG